MGGPRLVLGDAVAWIDTRADLVLGGVSDPGARHAGQLQSLPDDRRGGSGRRRRQRLVHAVDAVHRDQSVLGRRQPHPMTVSNSRFLGEELSSDVTRVSADGRYFVYPSIVRAVAADSNIVLADNAAGYDNPVLLLAPSAGGQLECWRAAPSWPMAPMPCRCRRPMRRCHPGVRPSAPSGLERPHLTNTSKDGVQPGALGYKQAAVRLRAGLAHEPRALHASDTVAGFCAVTGDILGLKERRGGRHAGDQPPLRTPGTRPPCRYRCGRAATSCAWMSPRCTTMRATCR